MGPHQDKNIGAGVEKMISKERKNMNRIAVTLALIVLVFSTHSCTPAAAEPTEQSIEQSALAPSDWTDNPMAGVVLEPVDKECGR